MKIPTFPTFKTNTTMQTEKDKYIFGVVKVGDKGQIVIPKEAREVFGIEAGDSLLVLGDRTKGLAIVKTQIFDSAVEGVFK